MLKKESGSTIIFGLMILMSLSIMLGGLFTFSDMQVKSGKTEYDLTQAKYAAEAGMDYFRQKNYSKDYDWSWLGKKCSLEDGVPFGNQKDKRNGYAVVIKDKENQDIALQAGKAIPVGEYLIQSVGMVNGYEKTLYATLTVDDGLEKYALYIGNEGVESNKVSDENVIGEIYIYGETGTDLEWKFGDYADFKDNYLKNNTGNITSIDDKNLKWGIVKKSETFILDGEIKDQTIIVKGSLGIRENTIIKNCKIFVDGSILVQPTSNNVLGRTSIDNKTLIVAQNNIMISNANKENGLCGTWISFVERYNPSIMNGGSKLNGVFYTKKKLQLSSDSKIIYQKPEFDLLAADSQNDSSGLNFKISNMYFK